jgi:hypothetical protein
MSSNNKPSTSGRKHHPAVCYYHNTLEAKKNNYPKNGAIFNGNTTQFSVWKNEVFNHVMRNDVELWDIVENSIDIKVNIEGMLSTERV